MELNGKQLLINLDNGSGYFLPLLAASAEERLEVVCNRLKRLETLTDSLIDRAGYETELGDMIACLRDGLSAVIALSGDELRGIA